MAQAQTRAMMRDVIRHNLNKTTARDYTPTAAYGDPSSVCPEPSNATLNEKLREAVSMLIRKTGFAEINPVDVDIDAQTENGTYSINLRNLPVPINQIRRASWNNGDTYRRLTATQRDEFDNNRQQWENETPSEPRYYWQEGYTLYLLPAPSEAGTLRLIAGTGSVEFETDANTVEQLLNDEQPIVTYLATALYAMTQHSDNEMKDAAKTFLALGQDGINDILKRKQATPKQHQGQFTPRTRHYRSGRR